MSISWPLSPPAFIRRITIASPFECNDNKSMLRRLSNPPLARGLAFFSTSSFTGSFSAITDNDEQPT
eukprot:1146114-Amorphochlora_amoeboformis.AAC.1